MKKYQWVEIRFHECRDKSLVMFGSKFGRHSLASVSLNDEAQSASKRLINLWHDRIAYVTK